MKNVCKTYEFLKNSRVQGARIGLKINVKNTKSLRLGLRDGKRVMLGKEKTDKVDSFTNLGSISP